MDDALTRAQVREVDRIAIRELKLPGVVLMENAGRGVVDVMLRDGIPGRVLIVCGKGNNAGDGYVMARHLARAGSDVQILNVWTETLSGDAGVHQGVWRASGGPEQAWRDGLEVELAAWRPDWVVDALLGTGATGPLRPPLPDVLAALETLGGRRLSVDVPTGMDCDTGESQFDAFRADVTCTFVALKVGFQNPSAAHWLGQVHVVDIGVPQLAIDKARSTSPD